MSRINESILLKERDLALRDSNERTKALLEKTAKLGLIKTYSDPKGKVKIRTKKNLINKY